MTALHHAAGLPTALPASDRARWPIFAYGAITYSIFLGVFLYALGFVGGFIVPKSIDSAETSGFALAVTVNLGLLALFALQHSVMARPTFKRWWTTIVPPVIERSTYVLATNLCLIVLFILWQPITTPLWDVQSTLGRAACWTLFAFGWGLVLVTTFLINHFDLFGLRQVWLRLRGREYAPVGFVQPAVYKLVRHPLYVGWMIAFWATPTMSLGHFLFAAVMTLYMLTAIQLEERNLVQEHGEAYRAYRRRTPMLLPIPRSRPAKPQVTSV